MSERPILFSGPMVRAIIDGRKTQTRRVLKPQPDSPYLAMSGRWLSTVGENRQFVADIKLPYAVGDMLWVRETWAEACELDENDRPASEMRTYYRADGEPFSRWLDPDTDEWRYGIKWKPSIFMPRWASRITLRVTDVRVQRLQDISEDDAKAEGVERLKSGRGYYSIMHGHGGVHLGLYHDYAKEAFEELWTSIHGPGSWHPNPWVAAITFERGKP